MTQLSLVHEPQLVNSTLSYFGSVTYFLALLTREKFITEDILVSSTSNVLTGSI